MPSREVSRTIASTPFWAAARVCSTDFVSTTWYPCRDKLLSHHGAGVAVGVGQQNRALARKIAGRREASWHLLIRQEDAERGSAHRVALRPDAARVLLNDGAADGQAQTAAALLPGIGGIDLLEPAEDRSPACRPECHGPGRSPRASRRRDRAASSPKRWSWAART